MKNYSCLFSGIIVAALFANAQLSAKQQGIAADNSKPVAEVSFTLFHYRVYLPVEVNGHGPIEMVLDTGAAISGLDEATARSLGLREKGKAQLTGNGESTSKITITKDVVFRVGAAALNEKSVAIIPFRQLERHEGRPIAGVLGVNLFQRFIVVIDYMNRTLALYEPQGFTYRGAGEIIPLQFHTAALFPATIELEDHKTLECKLAVDSGTYSALRLYHPFVRKNALPEAGSPSIDSFGFGIGGEFPEKQGRVGTLKIGGFALKQPTTGFSDTNSGATSTSVYDGTIGGAVLSRFKVILDYPHHQMILEPNPNFSEPFSADTSGVILGMGGPEQKDITVLHVLKKTPAEEAGMKEGDVLLSVNGQDAGSLGLEGIRGLFVKPDLYRLQLRRGTTVLNLEMRTTKPLF